MPEDEKMSKEELDFWNEVETNEKESTKANTEPIYEGTENTEPLYHSLKDSQKKHPKEKF